MKKATETRAEEEGEPVSYCRLEGGMSAVVEELEGMDTECVHIRYGMCTAPLRCNSHRAWQEWTGALGGKGNARQSCGSIVHL